jgi:hypothetical protein
MQTRASLSRRITFLATIPIVLIILAACCRLASVPAIQKQREFTKFVGLILLVLAATVISLKRRVYIMQAMGSLCSTGSTGKSVIIQYILLERGKLQRGKGSSFVRYGAFENIDGNIEYVSVKRWAEAMESGDQAICSMTTIMKWVEYRAFFFETKGVSSNSASKPFEFVLIDAPEVYEFAEYHASPSLFSEHLQRASRSGMAGCVFPNLGNDAFLVAPHKLIDDNVVYSHLAAFVRGAPQDQVSGLWRLAAKTLLAELLHVSPDEPLWLSTDGRGVPWLHLRLDHKPKYFKFRPYALEV